MFDKLENLAEILDKKKVRRCSEAFRKEIKNLDSNLSLIENDIKAGDIIECAQDFSIVLFVKDINGNLFKYNVPHNYSFYNVAQLMSEKVGKPASDMRFVFAGRSLDMDSHICDESGLQNESTLRCFYRL
jgi:hypothetical protein